MRYAKGRMFAGIERFGASVAIVDELGDRISYAELAQRADELALPLGSSKQLVAIEASNTANALIAYVGALRANHAVLLLKGGNAQDERIHSTFRPNYIVRQGGHIWEHLSDGLPNEINSDLAVLLSSSGSSGTPKLIRLSHENLISNAHAIAEYLEITPSDRALTTLPFFYSYGMSVVHSHLMTGASLLLDDRSVIDPDLWTRFEGQGGTSFAGVPHSFELLERTNFLANPPAGLRYVTAAGGKLAPDKVAKFACALADRNIRFFVMYGQTEASPRIAYLPPEAAITHPYSIGRAIPGGELALEDEDGRRITAPGVPGELVYRGPNVMMGYAHGRDDLSRGKDVESLRTGDLATVDKDGFFTIVGRLSRFVKLFGLRIDLDDVEQWCGARSPGSAVAGDDRGIVLATIGAPDATLGNDLAAKLVIPQDKIAVVGMAELPRLASGKVDYPRILQLRTAEILPFETGKPLAVALAELLRIPAIGPNRSFIEAGGDSLNIVSASILIEDRLGQAPPGWERMSMAELDKLVSATGKSIPVPRPGVPSDILARAVCILLVVLHHGADIALEGAAIGLLMIAGFNFGRLQAPAVMTLGPLVPACRSLRRIVPLYIGIMVLYFIAKRDVFWPNIFLYSTFTRGYDDGATVIGLYWFIETYIWLILFSCLLVAVPFVARLERERNIMLPLIVLVVALALHLLVAPTGHVRAAELRSSFYLYYVFALGWILNFGTTRQRKLLLSIVALTVLVLQPAHRFQSGMIVTTGVAMLLLWIRRVEFGSRMAAWLTARIAHSSLYIYLVHPAVFMPLLTLFGRGEMLGIPARLIGALLLTVPLSVAAGLLLHALIDWTEQVTRDIWSRRQRAHAPLPLATSLHQPGEEMAAP
ncbi:hypothetical protein C1T17_13145 [Sphingobium sp. SCG-1]|uniref:AMP-binding protein n=1 Tax=Sphingobium sp. SCG-1 TaxID=2072936 RepID=UPI000CD69C31|nr:AMP-binding protein [Sphingobium sp. SCG-1]AUW58894.1 hypothetical protein C1T17_13145 [Sphingobium sp. SCG-1]